MAQRSSSLNSTDSGISREIGTQYAVVKTVADNLGVLLELSEIDIPNITATLDNKVDKVPGKQLSDNNYTSTEKSKLAGLESSKFKGQFVSLSALQSAFPVSEIGSYANVDAGVGSDVKRYIWDSSDTQWVQQVGTGTELTGAQIKVLYEDQPDTNAYTDAEKEKLGNLSASASVSSVGISVPTGLVVSNSPVTSSGVISITFALGYSLPSDTKQSQWDIAYTERSRWDGGSTGLNVSAALLSLGVTTVGGNILSSVNPNTITFMRVNADNTVTYLNATDFKAALGGTGLTYLLEAKTISTPNASTPVTSISPAGAETNIDLVIAPKGTGSLLVTVPDNTIVGGQKRGTNAVDLQKVRSNASQVAAGQNSFIHGQKNRIASSGTNSVVFGEENIVVGSNTFAAGYLINASAFASFCAAFGSNHTISGVGHLVAGLSNQVTTNTRSCLVIGELLTADGENTVVTGKLGDDRSLRYSRTQGAGSDTGVVGSHQYREIVLRAQTSDNSITPLKAGDSTAALDALSQVVLPNNATFLLQGRVVAKSGSETKSWSFVAQILRGSTAASTIIVGSPTITPLFATAGSSGWGGIQVTTDTSLGALLLNVTGQTSTVIDWIANIDSLELISV